MRLLQIYDLDTANAWHLYLNTLPRYFQNCHYCYFLHSSYSHLSVMCYAAHILWWYSTATCHFILCRFYESESFFFPFVVFMSSMMMFASWNGVMICKSICIGFWLRDQENNIQWYLLFLCEILFRNIGCVVLADSVCCIH